MTMFAANCSKLSLSSVQLLRLSVTSQIISRPSSYESRLFPDYEVIYRLNTIKNVSIMNRMKYNTTVFAGITMPLAKAAEYMNVISWDMADTFIVLGMLSFCNYAIIIFRYYLIM